MKVYDEEPTNVLWLAWVAIPILILLAVLS